MSQKRKRGPSTEAEAQKQKKGGLPMPQRRKFNADDKKRKPEITTNKRVNFGVGGKKDTSEMNEEFKLKLQSHATLDEFISEEIIRQIQEDDSGKGSQKKKRLSRRNTITSQAENISEIFHAFDRQNFGFLTLNDFTHGMMRIADGPAAEHILCADFVLDEDVCQSVFHYLDSLPGAGAGIIELRQFLDFCSVIIDDPDIRFVQEMILAHAGIDPTSITRPGDAGRTQRSATRSSTARFNVSSHQLLELQLFVKDSFKKPPVEEDDDSGSLSIEAGQTLIDFSEDSSSEDERTKTLLERNRTKFFRKTEST